MDPLSILRRYFGSVEKSAGQLAEIREGVANLASLLNDKLGRVIEVAASQSASQLAEIREGVANLASLLNDKLGRVIEVAASQSASQLAEIREGIANLTATWDDRLDRVIVAVEASETLKREGIANLAGTLNDRLDRLNDRLDRVVASAGSHAAYAGASSGAISASPVQDPGENDIGAYAHVFDDIAPYAGSLPEGFFVDWLGVLTDGDFRAYLGLGRKDFAATLIETRRPIISDGEGWFEAVNMVEAARAARERFVMVTLGACYGAQAVGCVAALRKVNPIPYKLVAVEPEPSNFQWVIQHFRDNGIIPGDQWLINAAISDSNAPVFFPVGAPGTGAQNSFSTNEAGAREHYVRSLIDSGNQNEALRNLLLRNKTGLKKSLIPGGAFDVEITLLSSVTLRDILSPFSRIDYLESDIQQSEILVFPPFMDLLKRKVRRVHIGTHGKDTHATLVALFRREGWRIVFDYEPNSSYTLPVGSFELNDGVLTALNPSLC